MGIFTSKITFIPFVPQTTEQRILTVNEHKFKVEVADTKAKRSKGLGGREKLATDEGMLFVFDKDNKYPFWMKGLKFPLDFVWIKDNQIVDIIQNVPPPVEGQKDEDLPIYLPKVPINRVLEINGGTVERLQIKVGDKIKLE